MYKKSLVNNTVIVKEYCILGRRQLCFSRIKVGIGFVLGGIDFDCGAISIHLDIL